MTGHVTRRLNVVFSFQAQPSPAQAYRTLRVSLEPWTGARACAFLSKKMCTRSWVRKAEAVVAALGCEAREAVCSCSAHGARSAMRLSRCPLPGRSAMVSAGWILTCASPPAGRRATGAQTACNGSPGMGEAHDPDHPGSCLPCVPRYESRSAMSAMSGVSLQTHPWQAKSGLVSVV